MLCCGKENKQKKGLYEYIIRHMQRRHNESVCCLPNYTNVSIIKLMIKHRSVDVAVSLADVWNIVLHDTVASLQSESLAGERARLLVRMCPSKCGYAHTRAHTYTTPRFSPKTKWVARQQEHAVTGMLGLPPSPTSSLKRQVGVWINPARADSMLACPSKANQATTPQLRTHFTNGGAANYLFVQGGGRGGGCHSRRMQRRLFLLYLDCNLTMFSERTGSPPPVRLPLP